MKVSKGTVDKTCEVELNCGGYEDTGMIYVAHSSGCDMILGKPALRDTRATISPGTEPVPMQPTGMDRFSLRMWGGNQVTDPKSDLWTAANSILARADELAVRAAEWGYQCYPVVEFAARFPKEIPRKLLPLRKISHKINIIPQSSCIPTYRPSGDRLKQEITNKLNCKEISGRADITEDDNNAVGMFTEPNLDSRKEPWLLLDYRPRNAVTISNHTSVPNIEKGIGFVVDRPLWCKIDLTDRYHNIRLDSD